MFATLMSVSLVFLISLSLLDTGLLDGGNARYILLHIYYPVSRCLFLLTISPQDDR